MFTRSTLVRYLLLLPLFALGLSLDGLAQESQDGDGSIDWVNISTALDEAPEGNKKILIDFYTDWCGWCKRMDKTTYSDSSVVAYIDEHFVASKFNPEEQGTVVFNGQEYTYREFGAAMKVRGYPATAFIDENSNVLTLLSGYVKAEDFLKVLELFGGNAYQTMTWDEFVSGGEESTTENTNGAGG